MLEDFFENYFKIEKAYRKYFQDEMEKYHLTADDIICKIKTVLSRKIR